jgi:Fic family protein
MVYNSNEIENSTLTLKDTEEILIYDQIKKDSNLREVYEAKNLATITAKLLKNPDQKMTIELILALHKALLTGISDNRAGRFRSDKERVQVGTHL